MRTAPFFSALLLLSIAGCDAEREEAVRARPAVTSTSGHANRFEPYACTPTFESANNPKAPNEQSTKYLCNLSGAVCRSFDTCTSETSCGATYANGAVDYEVAQHVVCGASCESDDDCLTPLDGDAAPVCFEGRCQLPCDDSTRCPTGLECTSTDDELLLPMLCMQGFEVEDVPAP
ncbi:MAG: hypothetical protein U0271_35890 [Polyangiaceae bacterium]